MKVEAYGYEHEPGVSLQLISETQAEEALLKSLWKHGSLECNYHGYDIRYAIRCEEKEDA
jgi:hypothetical protein